VLKYDIDIAAINLFKNETNFDTMAKDVLKVIDTYYEAKDEYEEDHQGNIYSTEIVFD